MKKKRILLNWFEMPGRPELLSVFREISDKVDFIHLYYRTRLDRKEENSPFQMIYWFDYKSPWQLLEDIKPDKIITMEADDLLGISLIAAAKAKGIPTFSLQHGFVPDSLEEIFVPLDRESIMSSSTLRRYWKLFFFFLKSAKSFSPGRLIQYGRFMYTYFHRGAAEATRKHQYEWRKPDYYLCFSKDAGKHYKLRDKLTDDRLLELGVPIFDSFFKQLSEGRHHLNGNGQAKPYYLLIDTSFGEYKENVPIATIYRCYEQLAAYCARHNAILKVKLHPWNYSNAEYADKENIKFYRKLSPHDLNELIFGAKACFGFFSTLTLPVVSIKKLCQVVYDSVCFRELIDDGITPAVDFFTFNEKDVVLDEFDVNEKNLEKFTRKYLYKTDGKAAERLLNILLADPNNKLN